MGGARVRAPEEDYVGVLDLLVRTSTATCSKDCRQTGDGRSVSSAVATVDVVGAEDRAGELLSQIVGLIRRLRTGEEAKRLASVFCLNGSEPVHRGHHRVVPRGGLQTTISTN